MMVMQRIEWIDAAKGIGILLIMLSHCYNFDGLLYFTSGYIPLFFILSGITFNPYSSSVSLRKRLKRLLYPNFVYAFIITFLFSIPHLVFNWGWAKFVYGWANLLYSRNRLFEGGLYNNIMFEGVFPVITWFLTAMSISYIFLFVYLKQKRVLLRIAFMVSSIGLLLFLCSYPYLLPWSIDTALILWIYILFGYGLKSVFIKLKGSLWYGVLTICSLLAYIMLVQFNGELNYSIRNFGIRGFLSIPVSFLIGILYTWIVSYIAVVLKGTYLFKCLVVAGKLSLMLMCLHLAVYKFFDYFILMVGDLNINIYGWVFIKMSFAIIFVLFWKLFVDKYVMKYSILKWL